MLEDEGRDPQIVSRNRCALSPQSGEERCIMMRGLFVGKQNAHPLHPEESLQVPFVLARLLSGAKASSQFRKCDEW